MSGFNFEATVQGKLFSAQSGIPQGEFKKPLEFKL